MDYATASRAGFQSGIFLLVTEALRLYLSTKQSDGLLLKPHSDISRKGTMFSNGQDMRESNNSIKGAATSLCLLNPERAPSGISIQQSIEITDIAERLSRSQIFYLFLPVIDLSGRTYSA